MRYNKLAHRAYPGGPLTCGVRRIFQRGVSVTSHRDDVGFGDVTANIMS